MVDQITLDPDGPRGYGRAQPLQDEFEEAKASLLANDRWKTEDGGVPPGAPELRCDLALEGGGVKGIGLVGAVLVLDEAGYQIQRVAGTSTGAIAASLIASLVQRGQPMTELKTQLGTLKFANFMPEGRIRHFLDHVGRRAGEVVSDFAVLTDRMGLYPGTYLYEWLDPILDGLNIHTFGDLSISPTQDPGMSLPEERRYRLVVHTSDISRRQLVRVPWDCEYYGLDPHLMKVDDAVRASMSIPFFFEPFHLDSAVANVETPVAGGETIDQHYEAGSVTWVDGGMLRNFPIDAFDRVDGKMPRWPTIGIKLSGFQTQFPATKQCSNTAEVATGCLQTMMNEWDGYSIEEATAARTIFVDNAGLSATDFT